jgi:tetratricopeptide (TPR) repeat protein
MGRHDAALRDLVELEAGGDRTPATLGRLAVAWRKLGADDRAREAWARAAAAAGETGGEDAWRDLARILENGNLWDWLEEATRRWPPGSADRCRLLAVSLGNRGRLAEAIAAVEEAVEIEPEAPGGHVLLGGLLEKADRLEDADVALRRAMELAERLPHGPERDGILVTACLSHAHVQQRLGDLEAALAAAERARELEGPEGTRALSKVGYLLVRLERWEEAVTVQTEVIRRRPDDASELGNRAVTLLELGRPEEALAALDRALATEAGKARLLLLRGRALAKLGRTDEALADLDRVAREDEPADRAAAECRRAGVLTRRGDLLAALEAAERARALAPGEADHVEHAERIAVALIARAATLSCVAGRLDDAVSLFSRAVEVHPVCPDRARHRYLFGDILLRAGHPGRALDEGRRMVEQDPEEALGWFLLGQARYELRQFAQALAAVEAGLARGPAWIPVDVHGIHGALLLGERRDAAGAEAALARGIEAANAGREVPDHLRQAARGIDGVYDGPHPRLGVLHHSRARALMALERPEEALAELDRAIDAGFPGPTGKAQLAAALGLRGALRQNVERRTEEALADFDRALALDPTQIEVWRNRALVCRVLGREEEHVRSHRRALALPGPADERRIAEWRCLANAESRLGRHAESLEAWRQAADLAPEDAGVRHGLAGALARTGDLDGALPHASRALEIEPTVERFGLKLSLLWDTGRYEPIPSLGEEALQRHPDDARLLNTVAWYLATCPEERLRDATRAVTLARRAVGLAPEEGHIRGTLGTALYRGGEWKDALRTLERACELQEGGDAYNWFFRAMVLHRLDRSAEARTWFDRAVAWRKKEKPDDAELERFHREAAAVLGIRD